MALISNTLAKSLFDRMSAQASLLKVGINSGCNNGVHNYCRIHAGVNASLGDYELENALISSADGVDNNTFSGSLFKSVYNSFVQALETHVLDKDAVSFDSWLNISGINVHPDFEDVWFQCKGSHLDAVNVFMPKECQLLASYTASASGVGVFASGTVVGTGTGKVSLTNHAGAKLVLVPVGDTTADAQVNLRLLKENGSGNGSSADFDNIVVANGTTSGTQFVVKSNAEFLSCTNMVVAGGASGNGFNVYALLERNVTL